LTPQQGQPQGNPQQPGQPQGGGMEALKLAAALMAPPDPMQQLTMQFLQSSMNNQNAMAQSTINLSNAIAQMLVKEKIQVKTSET